MIQLKLIILKHNNDLHVFLDMQYSNDDFIVVIKWIKITFLLGNLQNECKNSIHIILDTYTHWYCDKYDSNYKSALLHKWLWKPVCSDRILVTSKFNASMCIRYLYISTTQYF